METYPISHPVLQHARQCPAAARPLLVHRPCLSWLISTGAASLAHASMQQEVSTWPAGFGSPLPPRPPSRSRLPAQASGPGCPQWPRAPLAPPQAPPPPAASSCCRPGQSALSELPSWHLSLSLRRNILPVTKAVLHPCDATHLSESVLVRDSRCPRCQKSRLTDRRYSWREVGCL